jgi:TRAP-type mannitol/chloroaromatic compound transport system permease large subunit
VLGSILFGIATPTEAAAVGAVGAILLAGHRLAPDKPLLIYASGFCLLLLLLLNQSVDLRLGRDQPPMIDRIGTIVAFGLCAVLALGVAAALHRGFRSGMLPEVMERTARISSMVFMIVIGAQLFSLIFRGFGGDVRIHDLLTTLPGGDAAAMLLVMIVIFALGFFLDFIEITFLVVPIVCPVLLQLGFDPVWLGVMIALNLQTSFLTPPFGLALFYLRGVAPPEVTTAQIYQGIIPFVVLQLLMLVLLSLMPGMATWLPSIVYR